jgi:dTDP-4-dehydrorhamnose 3,5-epimerase
MRFIATGIPGAWVIEPDTFPDERGLFARVFCREESIRRGLNPEVAQANSSFSPRRGTLRGMHYQAPPKAEAKLVRCTAGSIFDVVLDLRTDSPSYRQWHGVELSARDRRMLYVPEGCAHGLLTLADDTEVSYLISQAYSPEHARGVRWDDPAFGIAWPEPVRVIGERDRTYPDYHVEA